MKVGNTSALAAGSRRTATIATIGLGLGDPFTLTDQKQFALELGNCPEHRDDQFAGGRRGIYALAAKVSNDKANAFPLQCSNDREKIGR